MAGLYAAGVLKIARGDSVEVHLYELTGKVGGRIHTHHFTSEKDQYYEAGAMRIPQTEMHKPVMELIHYLNKECDAGLKLIDYHLDHSGNIIFVNGRHTRTILEQQTAEALGFDVPKDYRNKTANELLLNVIRKFIRGLQEDFEVGWEHILRYDKCSFRTYLEDVEGWPASVIGFVETVCSQTNQYALSFTELIMQNLDFENKRWKTLEDGMDRLPQALAGVIGLKNITFGARVQEIEETGRKVRIHADSAGGSIQGLYDKVILAIPPSAVRMIPRRPRWSPRKEEAIRSMYFEALYKLGLRFKTRFWEHFNLPSLGGQSTTDLPIRWIVYPSYGIETTGPGVLLLYSWKSDASLWSSVPFSERVKCALQNLAEVYKDENVDVYDEFIAANDMPWAEYNPTGDCMFLPGQFTEYFDIAQRCEDNIYFAGEHLSRHHTWITGAIDSGRYTADAVLRDLRPAEPNYNGWIPRTGGTPKENYNPEMSRKAAIRKGLKRVAEDCPGFENSILFPNSSQIQIGVGL